MAVVTDQRSAPPRPWLIRTIRNDRRFRYLAVGGVSAVSYYGSFTAIYLLTRDQVHYLVVPVFANLFCAIVTYPLQRKYVFQATGPVMSGFFKFYLVCLWALALTYVGLPVLVEVARVPVLIAQAVLIVTAPVINYQLSKLWAFRH